MMSRNLKPLFLLFILLEITTFIIVGSLIGILATLLLVVATTLLGFAVVRRVGLVALQDAYHQSQSGPVAWRDIMKLPLLLLSAVLLIIPGFITDFIGILLLIPYLRQLFGQGPGPRPPPPTGQDPGKSRQTHTIEGEYTRDDDKSDPKP